MYKNFFEDSLQEIKRENRYRTFLNIKKNHNLYPCFLHKQRKITTWCSNDYLGMSQNPMLINAACKIFQESGIGSGGTRNISGTSEEIYELEKTLANNHNQESALVFTSGYVANQTTLTTLGKIIPNLIMFSDQLNHASIIEGIKHSRCQKQIFRHNDMQHLEELLNLYPISQPKIIIFESIYSMEGDISPIMEICQLAKKYNAMTYIDEVHTVGIYGAKGAGITELFNIQQEIDIIQGTLGKAYGTIGGYITGKNYIIDAIRSSGSGFIFTTSIPPAIAHASRLSVEILSNNYLYRQKYLKRIDNMKHALQKNDIKLQSNANYHILPIVIGDAEKCRNIAQELFNQFQIYVQPINFPTVPKGSERLRITSSPLHTEEMFNKLLLALQNLFIEYKILETVY